MRCNGCGQERKRVLHRRERERERGSTAAHLFLLALPVPVPVYSRIRLSRGSSRCTSSTLCEMCREERRPQRPPYTSPLSPSLPLSTSQVYDIQFYSSFRHTDTYSATGRQRAFPVQTCATCVSSQVYLKMRMQRRTT